MDDKTNQRNLAKKNNDLYSFSRAVQQNGLKRCGRSGIRLPAISLGLWHNFGSVDDFENGRSIIRCAFDRGITHFDLANNYGPAPGTAEENFGKILKQDFTGNLRDELIISTKAGYLMWPGPLWRVGFT